MELTLHWIEKKILDALQELKKTRGEPSQSNDTLGNDSTSNICSMNTLQVKTKLSEDQIRRGIEWLKMKDLVKIEKISSIIIQLDKNGIDAITHGLPERKLYDILSKGVTTIPKLQKELNQDCNPSIGQAKRNGWIDMSEGTVSLVEEKFAIPEEDILKQIGNDSITPEEIQDKETYNSLKKRPGYIIEKTRDVIAIDITEQGLQINVKNIDENSIDVEAGTATIYAAKTHILKDTINEIREIFTLLGFSEVIGDLKQSSFWNFDALFTPQDHPAREMQDTFYVDSVPKLNADDNIIKRVSKEHEEKWNYSWKMQQAQRMVLRTHTTCITIRHLAETGITNGRVFSHGRVFRNEKASYKHLAEFNQVEGVIVGNDCSLRELMGIQREFYRRIGITKIKFWPTFFPYTEPSLQSMVYNDKLGKWIELFGMGIIRPEVTKPLGINSTVLAWGGGIERIAMLKHGINDVREFYNNDLDWIRGATKCPL